MIGGSTLCAQRTKNHDHAAPLDSPSTAWLVTLMPPSPAASIAWTSRSLLAFPVTKTAVGVSVVSGTECVAFGLTERGHVEEGGEEMWRRYGRENQIGTNEWPRRLLDWRRGSASDGSACSSEDNTVG
jgi:hypothetical protein